MKKFLIAVLLITGSIHAQFNFNYNNQILKWQKVFDSSTTHTKLNLFLKNSGAATSFQDDVIEFSIPYTLQQLEPFGFKRSKFPVFMNNGIISGYIELKDNRYRTTITSIAIEDVFNSNKTDELSSMIYKKNNQLRYPKTSLKLLEIYDKFIQSKLTYKPTKDDW